MLPRALDLDRRRLRVAVPMELRRVDLDAVAALVGRDRGALAHDLVSVLLALGAPAGDLQADVQRLLKGAAGGARPRDGRVCRNLL